MEFNYLVGISIAGMISGIFAGLIGGGAEIVIVPLLTFFGIFSSIKHRIGTTLFMLLPPVGIFTAMNYHKKGYVDIYAALYMGLLFTLFASLSANYSTQLDIHLLKRIFGIFTILCGIYIYFSKEM
tara:strand:- start:81 stop:458 length:378 start_codon:yes stop_codon:yes gene_type:complete